MNAKQLIAVVAAVAAAVAAPGTALARGQNESVDHVNFTSTKSRDEVRAELEQAHAQGWRPGSNPEFVEFASASRTAPGDAVRAKAPPQGKLQKTR